MPRSNYELLDVIFNGSDQEARRVAAYELYYINYKQDRSALRAGLEHSSERHPSLFHQIKVPVGFKLVQKSHMLGDVSKEVVYAYQDIFQASQIDIIIFLAEQHARILASSTASSASVVSSAGSSLHAAPSAASAALDASISSTGASVTAGAASSSSSVSLPLHSSVASAGAASSSSSVSLPLHSSVASAVAASSSSSVSLPLDSSVASSAPEASSTTSALPTAAQANPGTGYGWRTFGFGALAVVGAAATAVAAPAAAPAVVAVGALGSGIYYLRGGRANVAPAENLAPESSSPEPRA